MLEHGCDAGMSSVVMHICITTLDMPASQPCVWLSGVVPFQVCGCWCLYVGPIMMLAYSMIGRTSVV